ncbi:hypothetical protein MRS76_24400 [Rhizobiaceae bacterium n13]|uniref:hypothetical protein n=1 Tax=Ferirhizobium litorale TaxID=2927786 RepID=UPI0024B2EFD4|nr:hypothetical protein [Fererhizobium litorale]MDI7865062.1 hypothetical protein [Fererhizobium litorale]
MNIATNNTHTAGNPADPIIAAIDAYHAGNAAYCAQPDEDDAAIEATYGPPLRVLEDWDQPALTRQGAIAALQLAKKEDGGISCSPIVGNMLDAALAYFEKERATADSMTDEQLAALDFEPWQHGPDEWTPPSNVQWARLANPYLVSVRLAWVTLYKTKPELVEIVKELDRDGALERFADDIRDSLNFFKGFLAVLETAEARIICAGLSIPDDDIPPQVASTVVREALS